MVFKVQFKHTHTPPSPPPLHYQYAYGTVYSHYVTLLYVVAEDTYNEHIYEEIPETTRQQRLRPLPPIPEGTSLRQEKQKSLTQILHNRF